MQMLNKFFMFSQTLSSSPWLSWSERKFLRGAFYSFCLDYPQKKGNVRLHWSLRFHSTRFFMMVLPGEVRTQLFIGFIHSRELSDFECWQYSPVLGVRVRSRRPCWCTEKIVFLKKNPLGIWFYYYAKLEQYFFNVLYTNCSFSSAIITQDERTNFCPCN